MITSNCLNSQPTCPFTVSRPWNTTRTKSRGGTLLVLTAPSVYTVCFVYPILRYISALVYIEVLYVDVCVLVHFPVGQLAESDGLVLTRGPFTVNLTLLRGQSFFYYLTLWSGTSPSIHHTLLHLRMCCKFITKETIYNTIMRRMKCCKTTMRTIS